MPQFYVYVLHCEEKLADHAQHYVGATGDLLRRLVEHATGRGARITQVFREKGIRWRLASVFTMKHRSQFLCERRIKRYHQASHFCSVCSGEAHGCIAGATPVEVEGLGIPLTSEELAKL